jgi:hypothetical protein
MVLALCSTQVVISQVSKKLLENITFAELPLNTGGTAYSFRMDGRSIGPYMAINGAEQLYVYYDEEQQEQGFLLVVNSDENAVTYATMKDGIQHGNAWKTVNGELAWAQTYKKGEIHKVKEVDYMQKVNKKPGCIGDCDDGFGLYFFSKESYSMGYWKGGNSDNPMYRDRGNGNAFRGELKKGLRHGFGVYYYKDGGKYIGYWNKGDREGLGFMVNSANQVTKKGFWKNDEIIKNM